MTSNSIKAVCAALGCLAAGGALAQAKTDGLWRGNGGAALSLNSGNTTSSSLQLNADASKATAADKGELVSLLERCYMFLADNTHEAEEDAAELMAAIEKAIDLNEDRAA